MIRITKLFEEICKKFKLSGFASLLKLKTLVAIQFLRVEDSDGKEISLTVLFFDQEHEGASRAKLPLPLQHMVSNNFIKEKKMWEKSKGRLTRRVKSEKSMSIKSLKKKLSYKISA